jgi:hypothetical protein
LKRAILLSSSTLDRYYIFLSIAFCILSSIPSKGLKCVDFFKIYCLKKRSIAFCNRFDFFFPPLEVVGELTYIDSRVKIAKSKNSEIMNIVFRFSLLFMS